LKNPVDLDPLRSRLLAEGSLALRLRVIPKSGRTEWAGEREDGSWKVRIAAAPEKGHANEELIRFLAEEFRVRRQQIEIVSGATSQNKQVRIVR
jgi:uncharacterized protein